MFEMALSSHFTSISPSGIGFITTYFLGFPNSMNEKHEAIERERAGMAKIPRWDRWFGRQVESSGFFVGCRCFKFYLLFAGSFSLSTRRFSLESLGAYTI